MKNLMAFLVTVFVFPFSAMAQEKIWTWKPQNRDAEHTLVASAMDKDGSAVFVLSEFESLKKEVTFIVVWIKGNGKVMMTRTLTGPEMTGEVFLQNRDAYRYPIEAYILGPDTIAVKRDDGNGRPTQTRFYKSEGGKPPQVFVQSWDVLIFPGATSFSGWLAPEYKNKGSFDSVTSLTAWKL